jgi:hypothetical protein
MPSAPKILVTDDDPVIREMLSTMLHTGGYEVATAASGAEIISRVNEFLPDLILLDLKFPPLFGEFSKHPGRRSPHCFLVARHEPGRKNTHHHRFRDRPGGISGQRTGQGCGGNHSKAGGHKTAAGSRPNNTRQPQSSRPTKAIRLNRTSPAEYPDDGAIGRV